MHERVRDERRESGANNEESEECEGQRGESEGERERREGER